MKNMGQILLNALYIETKTCHRIQQHTSSSSHHSSGYSSSSSYKKKTSSSSYKKKTSSSSSYRKKGRKRRSVEDLHHPEERSSCTHESSTCRCSYSHRWTSDKNILDRQNANKWRAFEFPSSDSKDWGTVTYNATSHEDIGKC